MNWLSAFGLVEGVWAIVAVNRWRKRTVGA
jgi:hypothetical protein